MYDAYVSTLIDPFITQEKPVYKQQCEPKIIQVTENTLVIGIDIAKRTHYACTIDEGGRVLQKSIPILQLRKGFGDLFD